MSDVMKELKAEISRLSRKEIGKSLEPVKRVNAMQRGLIADLRRTVTSLQKDVRELQKATGNSTVPAAKSAGDKKRPDERTGFWITGKGIRSLRKRLGLTQPELATLAGVSSGTVVNWEADEGKIALRRKATAGRLAEIRAMGKRAAAEGLASAKA